MLRRVLPGLFLVGCLGHPGGGVQKAPERAAATPDPGRVIVRRLNRTEYCNTVRDLLGTSQRPCDSFPDDGEFEGFDTFAEVQSTSPLHLELYERAAEQLITELRGLPPDDPRYGRVFTCVPTAETWKPCAREVLHRFAGRAWRRPVAAAEIEPYVALVAGAVAEKEPPERAVGIGLQALLVSPNFLFRLEVDDDPASAAPHPLRGHELASRLSYTLWSTMPDDELRAAADRGALRDPAELSRQVRRMLASPRARAFARDFAGQWLLTRRLPFHSVDRKRFPGVDRPLREGMQEETERFVQAFLLESRPLRELLTADFTFVNDRVAKHYGLAEAGPEFRRASLEGTNRAGLLTQASVLTVTSHSDRTSPVKRGIWVLEQLLCEEVPPPPPDVQPLAKPEPTEKKLTLREQLEDHRLDVGCAGCHKIIDPIGFGLESFDAVGVERSEDNGQPVDSEGELPDGRRFSGPRQLAALLAADARFEHCFTERVLTYALGRSFKDREGKAWVARIAESARRRGGSLGDLLAAMIAEAPFRMRRGDAQAPR
jgi:hypothetical protein